ncbi:MAG: amidohydrolase family protein [Candidatus Sedimenticola endophacoides]
MMQTVDIHTHLLSPEVRFERLFDRVAMRLFGKGLGIDPALLARDPYGAYTSALIDSVRGSRQVRRVCLFGVDARVDGRGRELHRDPTVCAATEDVLALHRDHGDCIIPFLSVNPLRPDALDRLDEYIGRGCRGAKFLQNYWGVDLNDERFIPYYERLREAAIPLIIHIGSEYSIESFTAQERVEMLDLPLATGVTCVAAHMGLGRVGHRLRPWRNLSRDPRWFDRDYYRLLELLESHDNLYADISAILAPLRARPAPPQRPAPGSPQAAVRDRLSGALHSALQPLRPGPGAAPRGGGPGQSVRPLNRRDPRLLSLTAMESEAKAVSPR